jgi:hypothetical protein
MRLDGEATVARYNCGGDVRRHAVAEEAARLVLLLWGEEREN